MSVLKSSVNLIFAMNNRYLSYFFFLQDLIRAHSTFKGTLGEAEKELNGIVQIASEVKQYQHESARNNPYTTLQVDVSLTLVVMCALKHMH